MRQSVAAAICVLAGVALASGQKLSPEVRPFVKVDAPLVALTHVRVIDGTGAAPHENQTVVLSNGKIASVSAAAVASVPKDAQVLDLQGYSVIPGLVGMHDPLFYQLEPAGSASIVAAQRTFAKLYLASGVTTIRTVGTQDPDADARFRAVFPSHSRAVTLREAQQALARRGEAERSRFADEQRCSESILQILELMRQRRLRQEHALGRLDETAGIAQRGQRPEVAQFKG